MWHTLHQVESCVHNFSEPWAVRSAELGGEVERFTNTSPEFKLLGDRPINNARCGVGCLDEPAVGGDDVVRQALGHLEIGHILCH